jgi:hypothetical protein
MSRKLLFIALALPTTSCLKDATTPATSYDAEASACRAAVVSAIADGDRRDDVTYLLNTDAACASAEEASLSALDALGYDAFPWSDAFGRHRVFCANDAPCWPVNGAARVSVAAREHAPEHATTPVPVPDAVAACSVGPKPFFFQVGFMNASKPSYAMAVTCEHGRWTIAANEVYVVY